MLEIYCDGSSRGNPGEAGWGCVVIDVDREDNQVIAWDSEQVASATNNQMELKALLRALAYALEYSNGFNPRHSLILSDSAYCVNMFNDWIHKWAVNDWKRSKNQPVENLELVKEIYDYAAMDFPPFEIQLIKGHSGIFGNELADALASKNKEKFEKLMENPLA